MDFDYFNWIILPLLIFISRLADVTLSTLRHIFISKGLKRIVPIHGFFEVLIWLIAIRQVFNNLNNMACFLSWAAGFSAGTYLGIIIEERLAIGVQVVRIITNENTETLIAAFKESNQGVTVVDGQGAMGPVKLLFTVVKRTNINDIINLINKHSPNAFYSVEDIRSSHQGVFSDEKKNNFFQRLTRSEK